MRELVIDTSRQVSEKRAAVWETSIPTPYTSASTMSALQQADTSSDGGSGSTSPTAEVHVKSERAHSPSLLSPAVPNSPAEYTSSTASATTKDPSSVEEHRRIRVNERSKTGCITCRKRKKKCDEAKPFCNNCTKTNYTCEGYPSRKYWHPASRRGSRQKGDEGSDPERTLVLPPQPSLPTFAAVVNDDDQLFLRHYITKTSKILSMNDAEEGNPWTELILPMAKDDQVLMHSVLALAASHLMRTRNDDQRLNDRQMFHVDAMLSGLRKRLSETAPGDPYAAPVMASMMFQFLMSKNDVTRYGTPQACLNAARAFLQAPGTPFWRFAWGFCKYHEFSTTFTSLPGAVPRPNFDVDQGGGGSPGEYPAVSGPIQAQNFNIMVGLVDVPFMTLISKITMLRDQVRHRQTVRQGSNAVHYSMLIKADELGRDIAQWHSGQAEGTARHVAAELYRRAALLYLLRTVRAASSAESRSAFATCVAQGLECLRLLPPDHAVQSSLLLPTFILGCGAFEQPHRAELGRALDTVERYSGFGNVTPVRAILQRIWEIMDAGDVDRSWDWETITQEMGFAALIT